MAYTYSINETKQYTDAAVIRAGPCVNLSFSGLNKTGAMLLAKLSAVHFGEDIANLQRIRVKVASISLLQSAILRRTSPRWANQTTGLGDTRDRRGAIMEEDSCAVKIEYGPRLGSNLMINTEMARVSNGGMGSDGSFTTPLSTRLARSTSGDVAIETNRKGACAKSTANTNHFSKYVLQRAM